MVSENNFIRSWTTIDLAKDPGRFVRMMDLARNEDDNAPAQYQNVVDSLGVSEGQSVLDVGCGTGGAVRVLAERVGGRGSVVGIDNSLTMINEAKKRSERKLLPVSFHQANAQCLPFADNSFDSCFALRLFEIVEHPELILKEMCRVTRPGGMIYVNAPDVDMWTFDATDRDTTRTIVQYICDHEVNGWIGRQLPRMFAEIGLHRVNAIVTTFDIPGFEMMCDLYLYEFVRRAQIATGLSRERSNNWLNDLKQKFVVGYAPCTQTSFRVIARKAFSC